MKSIILMAAMYALTISASAATKIDLDGPGWTFRTTLNVKPIAVTVPHCWPVMDAYRSCIGLAIYERDFTAPPLQSNKTVRLHFDTVYEHASVWLNGRKLGTHEGG